MNNKQIVFYRIGNLNPVKHKEARKAKDGDFHIAPRVWGIYAFPVGYIEPFLLGGNFGNKYRWLLDQNGNKISETEFYEENFIDIKPKYKKLLKRYHIAKKRINLKMVGDQYYMTYLEKPHIFQYDGDIWHHLGEFVKNKSDILETSKSNTWVKTSFKVYLDALHRCDIMDRFALFLSSEDGRHGNAHTHPLHCTKDHYEVFLEKIK